MIKLKKLFSHLALPLVLSGLFIGTVLHTAAQSEQEVWATPVNLSRSGSAIEPALAIDVNGTYHLFWQDPSVGFEYASGNSEGWSEPVILLLPFSEPPFSSPGDEDFDGLFTPLLVADASNNIIHSFWRDEVEVLWYSRGTVPEISARAGWTTRVELSEAAIMQDVVIDASGRLHLSYIKPKTTDELTAGVYYRQSADGGATWTDPVQLYQSNYFHVGASDQAHVKIVTSDGNHLYVVWDNRLLDTVFVTHSPDAGVTWAAPVEVDKRGAEHDNLETPGPSHIEAVLLGDEVHLTWQASHEVQKCGQYHAWSTDQGQSWQPRQVVLDDAVCPSDGRFITHSDLLFLLTRIDTEAFLQAWDGTQWSTNTSQPLAQFTDPQTYRKLKFDCLHPVVTSDNLLSVIGCGTSTTSNDIWLLQRPWGTLADWSTLFKPTPVWSEPEAIVRSDVHLQSPELVAGADGRVHAVWSQSNAPVVAGVFNDSTVVGDAIQYSQLDAGQWLPPRLIVASQSKAERPAMAASNDGNLYLVWSGGESSEVHFSRAFASRAASVSEWFEPQLLSAPEIGGSWPDIFVNNTNTIFVVYAVPLNEDRGLYLTKSVDDGNVWSEPERVFDGRAAGWEMVGRPRLTVTGDNTFHLLWTQHSTSSDARTLALVYARSEDGGQSWSEPEIAVEESVTWSEIVGISERNLHRAWVSRSNNLTALWHQQSLDGGITWSAQVRVSDPSVRIGPTTMIVDAAGEPHLLLFEESSLEGNITLREWAWRDGRWNQGEDVQLGADVTDADGLAAVLAPDGMLNIVYSSLITASEDGQLYDSLLYSNRQWEAPEAVPTPLPPLTPTPAVVPTGTPTPEPSPTPTAPIPVDQAPEQVLEFGPISTRNAAGRLILGIIPAALIVLVAFTIGLRLKRRK